MSRTTELDLLSTDTQTLLADTTVTVMQNRPEGPIDPDLRERTVDAGASNPSVSAVEEELAPYKAGTRHMMRRAWVMRAADIGYKPSRKGTITDSDARVWHIAMVEELNNGREYRVVGERPG